MSAPKAKANEVLSSLQIESPDVLKHLKEICCERGAYVKEAPLAGSEGRLVVAKDKGIITVPAQIVYPGRKRFSIAHELGHFELHRSIRASWDCTAKDIQDCKDTDEECRKKLAASRKIEREANEFAAELLMPEKFLKPVIEVEKPDLQSFKEIANQYQVSLSAALNRMVELTSQACAVVFTKNNKITHFWRSKLFEKQKYWIAPGEINPDSYAAEVFRKKKPMKGMSPVFANTWLKLPEQLAQEPVHEQSEYFQNLGMGVTLLWIKDGKLIRKAQ